MFALALERGELPVIWTRKRGCCFVRTRGTGAKAANGAAPSRRSAAFGPSFWHALFAMAAPIRFEVTKERERATVPLGFTRIRETGFCRTRRPAASTTITPGCTHFQFDKHDGGPRSSRAVFGLSYVCESASTGDGTTDTFSWRVYAGRSVRDRAKPGRTHRRAQLIHCVAKKLCVVALVDDLDSASIL
jgi:hypothetical protein